MGYISDFAQQLMREHRAELTLRGGRLEIWPPTAWNELSVEERDFVHTNWHALKALVRDGRQPRLPDDIEEPNFNR
jgi:hypothetical protein